MLEDINKIMFNFIWDDKPDKIKRKIMMNDYIDGGLRVPNIFLLTNSIKASWVKRLLDDTNKHQYKIFYNLALSKYGDNLVFESNLDEKTITRIADKFIFLKDILLAWSKICKIHNTKSNVSKVILWNNTDIKVNQMTFFYKTWYEKGVKFLQHIYDYRKHDFLYF